MIQYLLLYPSLYLLLYPLYPFLHSLRCYIRYIYYTHYIRCYIHYIHYIHYIPMMNLVIYYHAISYNDIPHVLLYVSTIIL